MEIFQTKVSDKPNSTKFSITDKGEDIGYGYLFERDENQIEIYIQEKHQSKGYGKILFQKILAVAKNQGIKAMIFDIKKEGIKARNIILQSGAEELGIEKGRIKYLLKV